MLEHRCARWGALLIAMAALTAMQSVDAGAIAAQLVAAGKPERIAAEVRDARIAAIRDRRDAAS